MNHTAAVESERMRNNQYLCISVFSTGAIFNYFLKFSCKQQLIGFKHFKGFKHVCKKIFCFI